MPFCTICGENMVQVVECKMCGEQFCEECGEQFEKLCVYCMADEDTEYDDEDMFNDEEKYH
jgi:hypothetical protein